MIDSKPLDYGKLLEILRGIEKMGEKVFHPSTIHKPVVSITTPTVRDNVADFGVEFEWDIPRRDGWESTDRRRWTRIKNVDQFLAKLEKAAEGTDLKFGIDWRDVEFGVRGGESLPNNVGRSNHLVMYVLFWVKAAPAELWKQASSQSEIGT